MKAKYYPQMTILEAKLGSKPFFAWCSINGAGDLLKAGLLWRIGDEKKAHIWGDKWLPRPSTFKI
jgi:hypothetical protein